MYSMCMSHRKIQYEYVKKSHGVIFLLILPEVIFFYLQYHSEKIERVAVRQQPLIRHHAVNYVCKSTLLRFLL
jgi:hypothetical protein